MATVAFSAVRAARIHVVACSDSDAKALADMLALWPMLLANALQPLQAYLDRVVSKPWGFEYKIYEDALSEAWMLVLQRGTCTSMHAHTRKATILVCVEGEGVLTTGDGDEIELTPGVVVVIAAGARHQSSTADGMRLVELESPKLKRDLVRYDDPTRAPASCYENEADAAPEDAEAIPLAPLAPIAGGPPLALLRPAHASDGCRLTVETGAQLAARPDGLCAAISLDLGSILRGDFSVITPPDLARADGSHPHLTIRWALVSEPARLAA